MNVSVDAASCRCKLFLLSRLYSCFLRDSTQNIPVNKEYVHLSYLIQVSILKFKYSFAENVVFSLFSLPPLAS